MKYTQPNGVNIKHIDANGDGIINPADTVAIADYYADIHAFVPEEVLAIKDYPFALIPNATELDSGDLLILDVAIGSNTSPLVDIFGLAFGLNVSPAMIDSASLSVNFDKSSWFSNNSPTLQMYKQPKEGKIHAAFTRTSSIVEDEVEGIKPPGVSGNGIIGQIVFIVEDEVEGIKSSDDFITRRISTNGIQMEDADGERYQLPDTYIDVKVRKNSNAPNPTSDKLIVFPNPATENVLLHFNGRNEIKGYKVYNQMGELIIVNNEVNAQATSINVQNLPLGMYVVKVVTTQGTITKKILVSPRK
ncbi:MAG: T9SS type A sorting domain-containing protein [Saprospiraceae bacterium]